MQYATSCAHCTQRDEPQEADVMPPQLERMSYLIGEIGVMLGAMAQDAEITASVANRKADPLLAYYMRKLNWIRNELRCERDTLRQDFAAQPAPVVGDALLKRAYEVVHHEPDCPSIGGNGDKDCKCDAVPFLRDLESALTGRGL